MKKNITNLPHLRPQYKIISITDADGNYGADTKHAEHIGSVCSIAHAKPGSNMFIECIERANGTPYIVNVAVTGVINYVYEDLNMLVVGTNDSVYYLKKMDET